MLKRYFYSIGSVVLFVSAATVGLTFAAGIIIPSDSSFNVSSATLNVGGDINISGGTLEVSTGAVSLSGSWNNSGTFVANNTAVTFNPSAGSPGIISPSSNGPFYDLIINDGASGIPLTLDGDVDIDNNLTIVSGTLNGGSFTLNVGGSWNNSGTFSGSSSTVVFDAGLSGKTIKAGAGAFNNIKFNNSSGSWTIQTDNLTAAGNLSIVDCAASSGFVLEAGRMLTVKGFFTNAIGGAATVWNAGSVLNLTKTGGGSYALNSKVQGADAYPVLEIGADTGVRMWNSSASGYAVSPSGSLYSMDHADNDGDLYIWGDYAVPDETIDHWSYATDFDGVSLSGGSERQVDVRFADGSNVTMGSGERLQIIGVSGAATDVSRQGASGAYGMRVIDGNLTINRANFTYIDADGLNISGASVITSLDRISFDNSSGAGASDAFITVSNTSIDNNPAFVITYVNFNNTNAAADYNVRTTGTAGSFWDFDASTGDLSGEAFDSDPGGDPGFLVWDDSAAIGITINGTAYDDDDEAVTTKGAALSLAVNEVYQTQTTTSAVDGSFSFSGISVSLGDSLTVYFDGESFKGAAVSIAAGSNIADMRIYKDHLLVRSEPVGAVAISQLAKYDRDQDTDIPFDAENIAVDTLVIDDGIELFIPSGEAFQPLGNLESGINGVYDVDIRGAFGCAGSEIIRVSGSWQNDGSFSSATSIVRFDPASGTPAIDPGTDSFYNVIFDGSVAATLAGGLTATNDLAVGNTGTLRASGYPVNVNGNLTVSGGTLNTSGSNLDVDGDVGISSGTLTAPDTGKTFTIGGNYANTGGAFTSATGTVTFNKASGTQTVDAGGTGNDAKDFYHVEKSGGGSLQLVSSGFEADGTLTIGAGLTFYLNGQSVNLGTLDNAGIVQMTGSEGSVSITNMDTAEGQVVYVGTGSGATQSIKDFGVLDYYDLSVNDAGSIPDTFRTSSQLGVNGRLEILSGVLDISFNANTLSVSQETLINGGTLTATNANIDANANMTLTSGQLTAPTAGKYFNVFGNLSLLGAFTHSSGQITLDANASTRTIATGENTLHNLTFDDSGGDVTWSLNSALTVNNLTITAGTLSTGSDYPVAVGGDWANDDSFISNSGTVTFNKASGTQFIDAGGTADPVKDFNHLAKTGGGTLQLSASGLEVDGTLTVSSGCVLDLAGRNLNAATLDNEGTVLVQGPETVSITTHQIDSGTVKYTGDGDASPETHTIAGFGSSDYCALTINDVHAVSDSFLTSDDLSAAGDLILDGGSLNSTAYNMAVNGNFTLASGQFIAPGSSLTLIVGDDFTVNGTFNANSGGVIFSNNTRLTRIDAPAGGLVFYDFNSSTGSKAIQFNASDTVIVTGAFTVNGGLNSTRIILNSTVNDTAWNLILNGTRSAQYVDVRDSHVSGTASLPVNPVDSIDSGNNVNWFSLVEGPDANALCAAGGRYTLYDGSYFWAFYIDESKDLVYKRDADGLDWPAGTTSVGSGNFSSLGLWEDDTYIYAAYSDGSNSYTRKITIATEAQGTQRTLETVADYYPQVVRDTAGYLHRAGEVKGGWRVYEYNGSMGANAAINVDISAVSSLDRAFILSPAGSMSVGRGAGGVQQAANQTLTRASFLDTDTVTLTRAVAVNDTAYSFYVVEETSGSDIYVVHGSNAFTANADADLTITPTDIPALNNISDTERCVVFLTVSSNNNGVLYYNQSCVQGWIDGDKNVQLRRSAGNSIATVGWMAVEFKSAEWSVQQGNFTIRTGTNASPQTQAISAVDPNHTFVYMNWQTERNRLDNTTAKVELYDNQTLFFSRQDVANYNCTVRYSVISHPNLRVQRGTDYAASADASETQDISRVDTTRAFSLSYSDCNGAVTTYPTNLWRAYFSSDTQITWDRSMTGEDANIKWQVVEFPRGFFWSRSTNAGGDDSAWNAEEKVAEDTSGYGHMLMVPLAAGNMMALYNDYEGSTGYIRSRTYTGSWQAEQTASSDALDATAITDWDERHYFSAVSDDLGYVYLIYTNTTGYIRYTMHNGTDWMAEPVTTSDSAGCFNPGMFYDTHYETLYAFWTNGTQIDYKRSTSQKQGYWQLQNTLRGGLDNPRFLGTSYSDDNQSAVMWREGSDSFLSFGTVELSTTIVDLVELYALGMNTTVRVLWRTVSEIDNAGFNIYRSLSSEGNYTRVNPGLIPGLGTSLIGQEYLYNDTAVTPGESYYYILESVESDGAQRRFGPVVAHPGIDSDADGMSDDYEYYYGLDPLINDAVGDPDGDGLTNLQEYQNISDPYSARALALSWNATVPGEAGVTVVSSSSDELILELITNEFNADNKTVANQTYQLIGFPEYSHSFITDAGKPMLPAKGVLLSMSAKRPVNITVLDYDTQDFSAYTIYPVPQKLLTVEGGVTYFTSAFYKDNLTYARNSFYPGLLTEVDYSGYFRDQSVARIVFYPLQYNPVSGELTLYTRLRVKITTQNASSSVPGSGASGVPSGTADAYKVAVRDEGVYRITLAELTAAGFNTTSVDPRTIKIFHQGEEINIRVQGEQDGSLDASDYLEFFGENISSRYTYDNVYWITAGSGTGKRIASAGALSGTTPVSFFDTAHHEANEYYWSEFSDVSDPWYFWQPIPAGSSQNFTVALSDTVTTASNSIVAVSMHGYNRYDNLSFPVKLHVNSYLVNNLTWNGNQTQTISWELPSYWLIDGNNTVKVEHALQDPAYPVSWVFVDWMNISYWRQFKARGDYLAVRASGIGNYTYAITNFSDANVTVYDVTDPDAVAMMDVTVSPDGARYMAGFNGSSAAGTRYAAVTPLGVKSVLSITADAGSNLRDIANQADYVVITHDDFYEAIQPLADYRRNQSMAVAVVNLSDVYDEFNYGVSSVQAIKSFLQYTYSNWSSPAPVYVLLVGDGTYDYRDDEAWGFTNYLPSALVYNTDFGETSTDDWFVCFDGDDDILPDMLIGRFPAKSSDEVSAMVNKTIAYENTGVDESWTKRMLYVSDDEGLFETISDALAAVPGANYTAYKRYLSAYANPLDCRSAILQGINDGAFMVTYSGHGGIQIWADEQILRVDDLASLTNLNKYPLMFMLNCVNGHFIQPMFFECLAEELLRPETKGAIAVFAPAGVSLPEHQRILAEGFYDALFKKEQRILGSIALEAKLYLFQEAGTAVPDVLQSFVLFGDPALVLRKPALPDAPQATEQTVFASVAASTLPLSSFTVSSDITTTLPSLLFDSIDSAVSGSAMMSDMDGGSAGLIGGVLPVSASGLITRAAVQPQPGEPSEAAVEVKPGGEIIRLIPSERGGGRPAGVYLARKQQKLEAQIPEQGGASGTVPQGFWQRVVQFFLRIKQRWLGR